MLLKNLLLHLIRLVLDTSSNTFEEIKTEKEPLKDFNKYEFNFNFGSVTLNSNYGVDNKPVVKMTSNFFYYNK